jgi:hypothetical protein
MRPINQCITQVQQVSGFNGISAVTAISDKTSEKEHKLKIKISF